MLGWLLASNPFGMFVGNFFSVCVGSAADVAVLIVLARLAARIPNARLARRIVKFTWFYAIGMATVLVLSLVGWLCSLSGANSAAAQGFLRILPSILVVPMLTLFSARLVVLFIVSRALGPTAEEPAAPGHPQDRRQP